MLGLPSGKRSAVGKHSLRVKASEVITISTELRLSAPLDS